MRGILDEMQVSVGLRSAQADRHLSGGRDWPLQKSYSGRFGGVAFCVFHCKSPDASMAVRIALADLGALRVVFGLILLSAADAKSLATDRAGADRCPVIAGFADLVKSSVAKQGSLTLVAL